MLAAARIGSSDIWRGSQGELSGAGRARSRLFDDVHACI